MPIIPSSLHRHHLAEYQAKLVRESKGLGVSQGIFIESMIDLVTDGHLDTEHQEVFASLDKTPQGQQGRRSQNQI